MTREFLKGLGLDDANIEKVISEHGKSIQAEQAKKSGKTDEDVAKEIKAATDSVAANHALEIKSLTEQITTLTSQKADLDKIIKEAPNLDDAVKAAVEEAGKAHKDTLTELEKTHSKTVSDLQRDSETADFLRSLETRFATPETETVFRQRLNEALQEKANEGKNRADLFADLIKGSDGKPRTDIFQSQTGTQQWAAGGTGTIPPAAGEQKLQFNFAGIRGRGDYNAQSPAQQT